MHILQQLTSKAIAFIFFCLTFCVLLQNAKAATYNIPNGDVAGLIAAINAANTNPGADTINLASNGLYTLTQSLSKSRISNNASQARRAAPGGRLIAHASRLFARGDGHRARQRR